MATDRLHVLMVLESEYPAVGGGGAEAQVRTLASGLRGRRQRVTIITPMLPIGPQEKISRVDGTPVCRLRYPRLRWIGGPLLWLQLALFLLRRRRRYDAWHVHIAHHMGAVCALLGPWLGVPVLVKVSGWWEFERGILAQKSSLLVRLANRCLLRASNWQAISHRIANALSRKGVPPTRIAAIPNAVDSRRFIGITRSGSDGLRFLFLGRIVHEKGLDTLLDAFADARRGGVQASLRLVGSGDLRESLQARAAALGLNGDVVFDGQRSDIERVFADADFAVLPSRVEGLSNTLLECMAAGLPVIASRVSGSEDLIRSGDNGWLFRPEDRRGLAECLADAARLPLERRLAMGARARWTVERHASLDSVLDRLLALYRGQEWPARSAVPAASRST